MSLVLMYVEEPGSQIRGWGPLSSQAEFAVMKVRVRVRVRVRADMQKKTFLQNQGLNQTKVSQKHGNYDIKVNAENVATFSKIIKQNLFCNKNSEKRSSDYDRAKEYLHN